MADREKQPCGSLLHADRCINPLNREKHKGSALRKVSKELLTVFPDMSENARICHQCRKMCNKRDSSESPLQSEERENKRQCLSREDQLEQLLYRLKEKFSSLPKNDPQRISILTIAPECWSVRQTASEFGCSERQARQARLLAQTEGVLATPNSKRGKILPDVTIQKVRDFYECDQNSRIMSNKKDTVSVKSNGETKKVQKRLLLSDMKVLHTQFKEQYPEFPIGLTKFSELRPKNCICAGSTGTHSVCVCVIHQNFKMMIDAAHCEQLTDDSDMIISDYNDCFKLCLCPNPEPSCFLLECASCPGIQNLSEKLSLILEKNNVSEIVCSCWQSTDRCTLQKLFFSAEDFVTQVSNDFKKFSPHHFIAKNQSGYFKDRKDTLKEDEVILQCDFSENYAFVVQDAAQGFHYNNDQCTVHPAVFYYRHENEVKHCSIVLLSESTSHDTAAVYILQQTVIPEIKKLCPKVRKIIYVTDGAKQHYKNRYQVANLVHHKEDFNAEAEWHFHATAHGKGACDGVGAILKREATRASLQAKPEEAILNSDGLFKWAKKHVKATQFFLYNKQQHDRVKRSLANRFSLAPAIPKIQSAHSFIVTSKKQLQIFRYSNASEPLTVMQF